MTDFFTEEFSKKLPLLLASLLLFTLTLYTFVTTGIHFASLFNFGSIGQSPEQLISIQSLLFLIAFSVTLSTSIGFGNKLKMPHAAIPLALYILIALGSFFIAPAFLPIFIAFAITFGAASILPSTKSESNLASLSKCTNQALTLFLIIVVLFSIVKVELNKTEYVDQFLTGAASLSPQLQPNAPQQTQNVTLLRSKLSQIPMFQTLEIFFSIFIALIIFSLISLFNFMVKLISYPINYTILKLSKLEIEAKE